MVFQLAYLMQPRLLDDKQPEQITKCIQGRIMIVKKSFRSNLCCDFYYNQIKLTHITE